MFSRCYKIWWASGLALLVLLGSVRWADAQVVYGSSRHMTRSLVWLSFTNSGTSSMTYETTPSRVMMRMTYPGVMYALYALLGTSEFVEYWGDKTFQSSPQKAEPAYHSAGEGVLVLTNVGGEKYVSVSGPRAPTEDILPMIYDIQNQKEAAWGIRTVVPQRGVSPGMTTANWWDGATPQNVDPSKASPYEIHNYDYGMYSPVQDAAESIHISQWRTQHDVVVTRKAYAWSNQDFDDFIIVELEFDNRGGQQLDGTYFGVLNTFYVNNAGTAYRWGQEGGLITYNRQGGLDDWYRSSLAPNFAPNPLSGLSAADFDGKYINYQYDGNSANSFEEDTGDPYFKDQESSNFPGSANRPEGTPIAPGYQFVAPLAFRNSGSSHVFNAEDQAQGYVDPVDAVPIRAHWYEVIGRRNVADPTRGALGMAEQYDTFTSPSIADPASEQMQWSDQIYGPYNLGPGEKAKIVLVYGFGSAAEFDVNATTGYPNDITKWSFEVGDVGPDARKQLLARGEEAMLRHLEHAQFAYDNGYQVPDTPPDVNFNAAGNEDAKMQLTWTDAAEKANHPDYGAPVVAGYRVYRSVWQESGPWELVGEVAAGTSQGGAYSWVDENSVAGFGYAYNVRAYAKPQTGWSAGNATLADLPETVRAHVQQGLEGGWSAPEQRMIVPASPVLAANPRADALDREILVVPNPFNLGDSDRNYQGTNKLRFVGVPRKARISIFTVSGDLVGVIDHDNPAAGEAEWQLKDRFLTGEATSAVYFYVVESLVPESMGQKARGAFVVNR